jgi:hypothetical protein
MAEERALVVGAGPAGLLAARALKAAGVPYDQVDRNPEVGGIWDIRNDWSPMYESAHFISSKTMSHLPGYPMPDPYPDYPSHRLIFDYLCAFARDYELYPNIRLNTALTRAEPDGDLWRVEFEGGGKGAYRWLFVCSGNTWDPNWPGYPGEFTGEVMHAVRYRARSQFAGKRVLVVGGGNSGCDIACDAALASDQALISLRRGYHFIPKYVLGVPADVFAARTTLPGWLERRVFPLLLKLLVGDLTHYGLPKPDHRVMESHPIMNTQILHHLGHGDLGYRPDIERLDGRTVHFVDGGSDEVDLILYATGYKVSYPFLPRSLFTWKGKYPELYLSALHRERDNLCCLGLHQTDGGAYDLFSMQADMMVNHILDHSRDPERARRFSKQRRADQTPLQGGMHYVDSDRHQTYVKKTVFQKHCNRIFRDYGWKRFVEGPGTDR